MALGNGERYYSPTLARFIQQDSFTGSLNTPQSLNRFSYVHNNPFGFTDPTGHEGEEIKGGLKRDAYTAGLKANGEEAYTGGALVSGLSKTGYDVWNLFTFGTLEREDNNVSAWERGEITTEQARWNTFTNGAHAAAQVGLMVATGGAGSALSAGAGLGTRMAIGAGFGLLEQGGRDGIEMAFGYRSQMSSAKEYAISAATGGLFGAMSGGKASAALAKEGKLTLAQDFKLLVGETKALGQSIGRRLNPRNYSFELDPTILGSSGGGAKIKYSPKSKSGFADTLKKPELADTGLQYNNGKLGKNDIDLRGNGESMWDNFNKALNGAFQKTGIDRSLFKPKTWVKDIYGKSKVAEWSGPNSAQVNVDVPHTLTFNKTNGQWEGGPDVPHVGWTQPGKGGETGHYFLNDVPYNRP
jgi:Bacterial toxin 47